MDDAKDDGALLMETSGRDLKGDVDLERSSRDAELRSLGPLEVAFSLFPVQVVLVALASEILFLLLFKAALICSAAF